VTLANLEAGRAPLADFNRWVDSLIADYKKELDRNAPATQEANWMAHIVQKEAIQNSADALEEPANIEKLCITFEMNDTIPPKFITITDKGTCGLTGRAFVSKEELDELEEIDPQKYLQERWARFEALSFPNINPIGRGSKGQGKWAFIGSSENKTIMYETLRKDAIYRIGGWLGERQLLQKPPEGYFAEELIKKEFNLKPLEEVGTRIIIVKPRKELWEGFLPILKCPIAEYIGETWWELIKKGASVFVKWREYAIKVETPDYYRNDFIQKNAEETWVIKDFSLNWPKNQKAKVKELTIIRSKTIIPEGFRGIAIQRNGMKIRSFDVQTENSAITKEIADYIYGWITFNEEGEKALRAIEDTTHYDFSASLGTFGIHVFGKNGWLVQEIRKFAEEKLGLGSKEKRRSERLDILAVNKLNKFASKYDLKGSGKPIGTNIIKKPPEPPKEIRIKMPKPLFPNSETRRVEFGESVEEIIVSVANDSHTPRKIKLACSLKTASRQIPERILKKFVDEELVLEAHSESNTFGPYKVRFDRDKFRDGSYVIEARIVLLEGEVLDEKFGKGMIIDQERELVYLNVDPPAGEGLFELIDRVEFEEETKMLQYRIKPKDDRIRIEINVLHPAYKHAQEIESVLSEHIHYIKVDSPNPMEDYELGIGAEAIGHHDLEDKAKLIRDEKARKNFVEQRDKDENYSFFMQVKDRASRITQEIRYEILGGS
jgi:hypothetical protein